MKAFDLISHCKLWPILNKTGIKGKMLQTIQSMYRIVRARIRNGNNVTEAFICQKGLPPKKRRVFCFCLFLSFCFLFFLFVFVSFFLLLFVLSVCLVLFVNCFV